jgi:hypothetical protein
MSEEIQTFSFEDGVEHKIDDLSDEGKLTLNKLTSVNNAIRDVKGNAEFELEKLSILSAHYSSQLQSIVNQKEERKDNEPKSNKK